jgi:hypothetical protein
LGGGLGIIVLVPGGSWFFTKRRRESQLRWMRRLPFGFDLEGYLDELTEERVETLATIRIVFATPARGADRDVIEDAIDGAVETENGRWKKGGVFVVSQRVTTQFVDSREMVSTSSYNNHEVHAWMRACVSKALLDVHETYPIDSIRVELDSG